VDKEEWWREWIQLWYIVRTFINVSMYPQHNNTIIKKLKINKTTKPKNVKHRITIITQQFHSWVCIQKNWKISVSIKWMYIAAPFTLAKCETGQISIYSVIKRSEMVQHLWTSKIWK
jgi:hypothetical protein